MNAFYWFGLIVFVLKLIDLAGDWAMRRSVEAMTRHYSSLRQTHTGSGG